MASIDIFLDPKTLQDFCANFNQAHNTFKGNLWAAMMTSMQAGAKSATISTNGKAGSDVFYCLGTLNALGYRATLGAGGLTVSWA